MIKRRQTLRRKRDAGLSILEMMVVLGIIALVVGIVAPRAIDYFGRAKSQTAEIQMKQIEGALQLLRIDVGRYPTSAEGLTSLISDPGTMPGWRGPYLGDAEGLIDPWGRSYLYTPESDGVDLGLSTLGRDGQSGGNGEDSDISL